MADRLRLALLITELRPAGAERVVLELATRLDRRRYEVLVCSLASPGGDDGAVAAALRERGVAVAPIRMRHKLDLAGARRLVRTLRAFRPQILHAHLFHANLAARLVGRRAGARHIVSTIHVVEHRPLRLRRLLERLGAGRDDRTVCVSQAVAVHARRDLGVRAPVVIPNGIDVAAFRDLPARAAVRARFGLGPGPVVGAIGRLTAQKGFDDLLRAFAALPAADPPPQLLLAGDGEDAPALRRLAGQLGVADRVRFLGFQPDVRPVLAALDVFCMPSRWEGFGLALLEALAAGVPAVATAVDSLPELLADAGVLVPPDRPTVLAEALAGLLADGARAADLGRRGPARAAAFAVEAMVAGYHRLYTELCPA